MFAGLGQALVLSSSECDFRKNWTHSFRGYSCWSWNASLYFCTL